MEHYYGSPRKLTIEGRAVEITFNRMTPKDQSDLRNFFQKYSLGEEGELEGIDLPAGGIEQLMIRRGLRGIKVNGINIELDSANPVNSFPSDWGMGDDVDGLSLYEEVIKTGVDKNRWLARRYPFNMVFAQYLARVDVDKSNDEAEKRKKAEEGLKNAPEPDVHPDDGVGEDPLDTQGDTSTPSALSGSDLDKVVASGATK